MSSASFYSALDFRGTYWLDLCEAASSDFFWSLLFPGAITPPEFLAELSESESS